VAGDNRILNGCLAVALGIVTIFFWRADAIPPLTDDEQRIISARGLTQLTGDQIRNILRGATVSTVIYGRDDEFGCKGESVHFGRYYVRDGDSHYCLGPNSAIRRATDWLIGYQNAGDPCYRMFRNEARALFLQSVGNGTPSMQSRLRLLAIKIDKCHACPNGRTPP
jgi:hypothetical protein